MVKAIVSVDNSNLENKLPTFVKGEYGFDIVFTLQEDDGSAINLAGKTVKFQTKNLNDTVKKIDGTCSTIDENAGTCKYTVQENDMNEVGIFEAEAELQVAGTSNRKFKLGTYAIFDEI